MKTRTFFNIETKYGIYYDDIIIKGKSIIIRKIETER